MSSGKNGIAGLLVGAAAALFFLGAPASAQNQLVRSYALNGYERVLDGQWEGIRYASDGNVYFASSTHSAHHGAAFFKYDPRTAQVTLLAQDITTICGENPQTNPQGKLHSDIVEANGWLYMSTHFSRDLPGTYISWSGSHVIGYELATGRFRDYGVVHPNYTSYSAIGVDPVRHYLYVFVTGELSGQVSYLYRIDTVTGAKTNLGQVGGTFNASMWMFVDRRGDVWFSVAVQNGTLRRVRGDTGQIDVYPNALPPLYRWDREEVDGDSVHQTERYIRWMQPLDGDRAVFTLGYYGGMIYLFDASQPIGSGLEFRKLKHIGYTDLGLALGGNRVFYYQRANRGYGHQGDQTPEGIRDFHLLSVSLDAASGYPITDHGLLVDQDGRLVWRLPSMMTNGGNKVFMTGDWWTIAGDLGTLRYRYTDGQEFYDQLPRGEFFAVADIIVPPTEAVTITPRAVTLGQGETAQFTASAPSTWTINPVVGSISPAGLYAAPATIALSQTVTVTARSVADPSRTGTATITLSPPVSISVTPAQVTLGPSGFRQFTAMVENTLNKAASWSLSPALGTITAAGLYTAPATVASTQTVAVTATSMADGTKSATASVTLIPPPAVSITSPAMGQIVSGAIAVTAAASSTIALAGVQFLLDGAALGSEIPAAPFTMPLNTITLANGAHTLAAVARDAAGSRTTSAAVTVTVSNDRTPPAVSVTSPAVGQTVSGGITLTATASDNVGVAGVQFQIDGVNFGAETTAAPYTLALDTRTLANGAHTAAALARNAAGLRTLSAPVAFRVRNTALPGPPMDFWSLDPADISGATLLNRGWAHADASARNFTAISGISGGALRFNGATSYAEVADHPHLNLAADMTICLWLRTANNSRYEALVSKYDAGGSESGYLLRTTRTGGLSLRLGANHAGSWRDVVDNTPINDGRWHHVATVMKIGAGVTFYIDGVAGSSTIFNLLAGRSAPLFQIGRNPWTGYASNFNGDLDQVRVYGYALKDVEVAGLYDSEAASASDRTPPAVSISAPADGQTVSGSVTITAAASDDVAVAGVQFLLDGAKLGDERTAPPYGTTLNTAPLSNGPHTLAAIARDAAGNSATSAAVTITVSNDTTQPAVAITSPAAGQTVSGAVTVTASASDNVGVAGVQFKLDGANLGAELVAAPYGVLLDTTALTNGPHSLAASARDAAGNSATSAAVTIMVANTDAVPPTVAITSPTAGQIVGGTVTVAASASDNIGVAGVQFLLDGAALGAERTAAPYTASLDTTVLTNANHSLAAVARDAAGNRTTSASVTIMVNNSATPIAWPPLASWSFDAADTSGSQLLDRSANQANLTAYRTTAITGKTGEGLGFNGLSSYAERTVAGHLDLTGDLTIAFWIRTTKSGRYEGVVTKYDAAGSESGYLVRTTPAGTLGILIGGGNLPAGSRSIDDTVRINDGQWHHAVVVIKLGAGVTFYVDGAPGASASRNIVAGRSSQGFNIGRNPYTGYGNYFTGDLDEVRLYRQALTAAEAAALYRNGG